MFMYKNTGASMVPNKTKLCVVVVLLYTININ